MNSVVFTHTGKLGDFISCWPIASWLYKHQGTKVSFVLSSHFKPFFNIQSLLRLQPFTEHIIFVDFKVDNWAYGGQPYKFNPNDYGVQCDTYYNIGFRPGLYGSVTNFYASEYGLNVDNDYQLEIGGSIASDDILCTEQVFPHLPDAKMIDLDSDVLYNARKAKGAKEIHCYFSGFAVVMDLANIPFKLYRPSWLKGGYYERHFRGRSVQEIIDVEW